MYLTREQMKQKAVKAMKKIKVYEPFIKQFEEEDIITMYISGFGYTIDKNTEDNLLETIRETEEDYGGLVYGVSKNTLGEDTVYSLLWIGRSEKMKDEVVQVVDTVDGVQIYELFAYVYNADYPYDSEFGYINAQNRFGGIRRVGRW